MFSNQVCDSECNNMDCYFDNGHCDCSVGCTDEMLGNEICNIECLTEECEYDYGDYEYCVSIEIFVSSAAGTIASYDNIIDAIQNIDMITTIYLLKGDHYLDGTLNNSPLFGKNYAYLEIMPFYCSSDAIVGCYDDGEKATITLTENWVTFVVNSKLHFENIIFSHDYEFDLNCIGCNYCPYTQTVDNIVYDDKGNPLIAGTYLDSSFCERFANSKLFNVKSKGDFTLIVFFI